jgi:hypothetical protein
MQSAVFDTAISTRIRHVPIVTALSKKVQVELMFFPWKKQSTNSFLMKKKYFCHFQKCGFVSFLISQKMLRDIWKYAKSLL